VRAPNVDLPPKFIRPLHALITECIKYGSWRWGFRLRIRLYDVWFVVQNLECRHRYT